MGGDEWEETRLVLLGELFGANAWAWLTEGTEGAGGERHRPGYEKISAITAFGVASLMAESWIVLSYTCETYLKVAERLQSSSLNLSPTT